MQVQWYSPNPVTLGAVAVELEQLGHAVTSWGSPELDSPPRGIVLAELPESLDDALILLRVLRRRVGETTRLLALGVIDAWAVEQLLDAGADDFLVYPCPTAELDLRLQVNGYQARHQSGEERQRRLEQRVAITAQAETLATLAGTLAHDFNNLLTAVLGNTELALMDTPVDSPLRYSLEQIDWATRRASELARQVLAYSGRGNQCPEHVPVNLNDLVREMADLLRVRVPANCAIRYHFTRPLPLLVGDPARLRQLVMNLVINAGESIGAATGTILLKTAVAECAGAADRLLLEVSDTGPGLSAAVRERIFDPFFSTKERGRGLGLAAVEAIVHAHSGAIEAGPAPNGGALFRAEFPVLQSAEPGSAEPELDWRGSGAVLLIDSDRGTVNAARRLLRKAGYAVLDTNTVEESLDALRRFANTVEAVVADSALIGPHEPEFAAALRSLRPDLPLLLWDADPAASHHASALALANVRLLVAPRPASIEQFILELRQLLLPAGVGQGQAATTSSQ
jgi:signal transduction histidine kinase